LSSNSRTSLEILRNVGATPANAPSYQTNNMQSRKTPKKIGAKKATNKTVVIIPDLNQITKEQLSEEDMIEPDSFQEYAPPEKATVKVITKKGAISLIESDRQDLGQNSYNNSDEELEAVIDVKAKVHAVAPLQQATPVLGSGSPLNEIELETKTIPENAAETIGELIEGLNYLFSLIKDVRGSRGLKEHDEQILRDAVKRGRELIVSLEG